MLEELRSFYTEVVGLTLGTRPPFKRFGYWLYAGDKDVLHLTETSASESIEVGAKTTFNHVAFACTGPAAYKSRLESCAIAYEMDSVPDTGQIQLFFTDPAGNGVDLNFGCGS